MPQAKGRSRTPTRQSVTTTEEQSAHSVRGMVRAARLRRRFVCSGRPIWHTRRSGQLPPDATSCEKSKTLYTESPLCLESLESL